MRKLTAFILALSLGLLFLAAPALAQIAEIDFEVSGDWGYRLLEDGTAELVYYRGNADALTIPEEIDGITVSGLGEAHIDNMPVRLQLDLTSVTIPDSVTNIASNPFAIRRNLSEIHVSRNHPTLEVVDGVLFSKPDHRLICYPCALENTTYRIPDGTRIIGKYAFTGCESLKEIAFPGSVTEIGAGAFYGCRGLTDIAIPEGVTDIADSAFCACTSLTGITIPDSVTGIGSSAFEMCTKLSRLEIPDSVTRLGDYAFRDCAALESITIPDSVTEIGANPFTGVCDWKLEKDVSITVSPDHPALEMTDGMLFSKPDKRLVWSPRYSGETTCRIPEGTRVIGDGALWACTSLTGVTIPDSVTAIGSLAFYCCYRLSDLTLPEGVTEIGSSAFAHCDSLQKIVIPAGATSIERFAFESCGALTDVTLPDGLTAIGDCAFRNCQSLTGLTIPESVTAIGEEAFASCDNLTVTVARDSAAEQYCKANGLKYADPDTSDSAQH